MCPSGARSLTGEGRHHRSRVQLQMVGMLGGDVRAWLGLDEGDERSHAGDGTSHISGRNGALRSIDRCQQCARNASVVDVSGTTTLPEPGRWLVTVQRADDDRLAEVAIPIGVTDSRGLFERADAVHAAPAQVGFWETRRTLVSRTLVIEVAVLLLGAVLEVARRRWVRPVRRSTNVPTSGR